MKAMLQNRRDSGCWLRRVVRPQSLIALAKLRKLEPSSIESHKIFWGQIWRYMSDSHKKHLLHQMLNVLRRAEKARQSSAASKSRRETERHQQRKASV